MVGEVLRVEGSYHARVNWLAHLRLCPTADPLVRLGTLAGDFVQGVDLARLHPSLRRGIQHHRNLDRFVDHHPLVAQSRNRLAPPFRRFAGVLVDVYYDHLLAAHWPNYGAGGTLAEFVGVVHRDLQQHAAHLPPLLSAVAPRLCQENWLASYADPEGIDAILARMQRRLRRDNPLGRGGEPLRDQLAGFAADFAALWPELLAVAPGLDSGPDLG